MSSVEDYIDQAKVAFAQASDTAALENAKAQFLGKQGSLTQHLKGLSKLAPEARRSEGAKINRVKKEIETLLQERRHALAQAQLEARLAAEAIDVSLPGRGSGLGGIHPVIQAWRRVEEIFLSLGFDVSDGRGIEDDWANFTAWCNRVDHTDGAELDV